MWPGLLPDVSVVSTLPESSYTMCDFVLLLVCRFVIVLSPPETEKATLSICDVSQRLGMGVQLRGDMVSPTFPITPLTMVFSIVTMLRIAPTPSASSRAPGSVITSIFFIIDAGMALKISLAFLVNELLGRPFL